MQVRRQRRPLTRSRFGLFHHRRPARLMIAGLAVASAGAAQASTKVFGDHQVGTTYANGLQISSDQRSSRSATGCSPSTASSWDRH